MIKEQCNLTVKDSGSYLKNNQKERFRIPEGYIPKMDDLNPVYHIDDIFRNSEVKNEKELKEIKARIEVLNRMQMIYWYDYIMKNMFIYASVEKQLWRNAVINLVSIIEALIYQSAKNYSEVCKSKNSSEECFKICPKKFILEKDMKFNAQNTKKSYVDVLVETGLLNISKEELKFVHALYKKRNIVHSKTADSSDTSLEGYKDSYIEGLQLLEKICNQLYENMAKYYKDDTCPEKKTEK